MPRLRLDSEFRMDPYSWRMACPHCTADEMDQQQMRETMCSGVRRSSQPDSWYAPETEYSIPPCRQTEGRYGDPRWESHAEQVREIRHDEGSHRMQPDHGNEHSNRREWYQGRESTHDVRREEEREARLVEEERREARPAEERRDWRGEDTHETRRYARRAARGEEEWGSGFGGESEGRNYFQSEEQHWETLNQPHQRTRRILALPFSPGDVSQVYRPSPRIPWRPVLREIRHRLSDRLLGVPRGRRRTSIRAIIIGSLANVPSLPDVSDNGFQPRHSAEEDERRRTRGTRERRDAARNDRGGDEWEGYGNMHGNGREWYQGRESRSDVRLEEEREAMRAEERQDRLDEDTHETRCDARRAVRGEEEWGSGSGGESEGGNYFEQEERHWDSRRGQRWNRGNRERHGAAREDEHEFGRDVSQVDRPAASICWRLLWRQIRHKLSDQLPRFPRCLKLSKIYPKIAIWLLRVPPGRRNTALRSIIGFLANLPSPDDVNENEPQPRPAAKEDLSRERRLIASIFISLIAVACFTGSIDWRVLTGVFVIHYAVFLWA